jgi:hypothetical protein
MQSGNTSKATCALGEKALINDDPIKFSKSLNVNDPDLGLDWRFSHGIGLTQTTIFPNKLCKNTSGKHCYPAGGREFTARELLSADNALEATGLQWKSYYCSNLYEPTLDCFRKYVGVGTQWTETTSAIKMNLYNQCKTQHPDWK